jgi:serine O-acetyltransferase
MPGCREVRSVAFNAMFGFSPMARTVAEIRCDVAAAKSRDPAARGVSSLEILAAWPGVHALLAHRVAHALFGARVPLLPRLIAALARAITGIEIHPAAVIGNGFFIDHGMGVVIGETAEIGDAVTMYQGVTLGGTGFATGKRHPTVQDNVTIGSGAKLLGPITVGHGAKIGANSVVIHDVPPNSTVVGNPGHPVRVEGRRVEGPDTDWIHLPDPVADAIRGLSSRIAAVEAEEDQDQAPAEVRQLRRAAAGGQPDGRSNPSVGPSPAGG